VAFKGDENYQFLRDSLKDGFVGLTEQIKELRIAYEQLRRDFTVGFVPRDVMDLRLKNIDQQIDMLNFNLQNNKTQIQEEIDSLRKDIEKDRLDQISVSERRWLHITSAIGAMVGILGGIIGLLEFFHFHL
jgi:hypothetical protein